MIMIKHKSAHRFILLLSLVAILLSGMIKDVYAEENPFVIVTKVVPNRAAPGQTVTIVIAFSIAAKHYLYAQKTDVIPAPAR